MTLVSLLLTPPISPSDGSAVMNWPSYAPPLICDSKVQTIDTQVLQRYLDRGGHCNVRHPGTNLSLLAWATKSTSIYGIQLLLNHGSTLESNNKCSRTDVIRFPSGHGVTAIHLASQQNFVEALAVFEDYLRQEPPKGRWDVVDDKGWTPLHYGVRSNACQAVDFLLYHGAFGSPKDRLGVTPLTLALLLDHMDMVRRLIHTLDDHDFVTLLQRKTTMDGADDKAKEHSNTTGLSNTMWTLLLNHHYDDVDWDDGLRDEWLYLAVFWNRGDVLALILQHQHDRSKKKAIVPPSSSSSPTSSYRLEDSSIIYYALQQGKLSMVKELYQAGHLVPITPLGDNPCLLYAAAHGFLDVIPLLYTTTTSDECLQLTLQLAGSLRSHVLHQLNSVLAIDRIMLLNPTDLSALAL